MVTRCGGGGPARCSTLIRYKRLDALSIISWIVFCHLLCRIAAVSEGLVGRRTINFLASVNLEFFVTSCDENLEQIIPSCKTEKHLVGAPLSIP